MMRAPAFWWTPGPGMIAWLLAPVGWIWGRVAARRMGLPGETLAAPVICIGNFVVGGAGKTPVALAVADLLRRGGRRPAFLSRGHGGSLGASPVAVEAAHHGAADIGDEPLLLARHAPTIVARDRVAGARAALSAGADVIVMDDGLQNPALAKRLTIAVVDAGVGVGNGLCLPAGPLRAPLNPQWALADAIVLVGDGAAGDQVARAAHDHGKTVFRARLAPDAAAAADLAGRKVLAFAGIGRPEKFFATLAEIGADIVARALPRGRCRGRGGEGCARRRAEGQGVPAAWRGGSRRGARAARCRAARVRRGRAIARGRKTIRCDQPVG